jgi:twitching motility protein PilT
MDFNKNLEDLCLAGKIDKATALEFSPNPEQLRMALKGIKVAASGLV